MTDNFRALRRSSIHTTQGLRTQTKANARVPAFGCHNAAPKAADPTQSGIQPDEPSIGWGQSSFSLLRRFRVRVLFFFSCSRVQVFLLVAVVVVDGVL